MIRELVQMFGAGGRMRAAATTSDGYDATSRGRRLAGFFGSRSEINSLLISGGDDLRGKSHKLVRENAWASACVDEWTSQAVGTGMKPQSRYLDPRGNREKASGVRKLIHQTWSDSADEMDAAGITDIYGFESLAWRCMVESGEGFIRKRARRTSDGFLVPIQYQLLEPDHVPLTHNRILDGGNSIRAGIEFNAIGQRVAYWMYPEHPGSHAARMSPNDLRRVPADQVIHFFAPIRPGQLRGEPWLARVLVKLYGLDLWDDATLERQKHGAMLLGWTSEQTPDGIDPLLLTSKTAGGAEDGTGTETAPEGVEFGNLESGTILRLMRDEQLNFFNAPEVGGNYAAFAEEQKRNVAQGVRSLPYENMTGDASKSNFSSHRSRRLAFQRIAEQLQYMFAFQALRPMWRSWMDAAVLAGVFDFRGYDVNPRPYQRVAWRMPRWDWLDPLNDAKAEVLLIDNLLKPRSQSIQERGYDEEDNDEQVQADQDREDKMHLRRRGTNIAGTAQPDNTPADTARLNNQ